MRYNISEMYVGIANLRTGVGPAVLVAPGLGSCVGVALYDLNRRVGGLLHAVLPKMAEFGNESQNPAKFVDSGALLLLAEVLKLGARRQMLRAKIAGGAQMFKGADRKFRRNIGERNVEAAREALKSLRIKIVAEDVGGSHGRTVSLDTSTGRVTIRMLGNQTRLI